MSSARKTSARLAPRHKGSFLRRENVCRSSPDLYSGSGQRCLTASSLLDRPSGTLSPSSSQRVTTGWLSTVNSDLCDVCEPFQQVKTSRAFGDGPPTSTSRCPLLFAITTYALSETYNMALLCGIERYRDHQAPSVRVRIQHLSAMLDQQDQTVNSQGVNPTMTSPKHSFGLIMLSRIQFVAHCHPFHDGICQRSPTARLYCTVLTACTCGRYKS